MAFSVESLTKKLEQFKISDDLSYEEDFLVKAQKEIEQEIEGSEISYCLSKRSMSLCFENSKMNKKLQRIYYLKLIG